MIQEQMLFEEAPSQRIAELEAEILRLSTPPDEGEECPTCNRTMPKWDDTGNTHKGAPENQHDRYKRGSRKAKILLLLVERPLTNDEIDAHFGWDSNTAAKRTTELVACGHLRPTERLRPTRNGGRGVVMEVTPAGMNKADSLKGVTNG